MNHHVSPEQNWMGLFKKANCLLFIMAMALALPISTFAQSPEVRNALRLIDIEQPSKGIAQLEQLANADGKDGAPLQYYLGLGYIRTGAKDKALAAFEKGISMDEKEGLNYAGKGHVKLLDKNTTEAKANFDKALAVSKSKDANVLKAVAEGYLVDSKYLLDAINLLNKAKSINGTDPGVHMLLGDAYLAQNNGGESVSSYERAARADTKVAKAHFKIAKVYQRSKNYDMVLESLNKAVTVDPEYAPAHKMLGEIYYVRKEAPKAVEAYEKYLTITENPGDAKFQLAFFYFMAKRFDKANAIFKEVTSSPNASPTALKYYAYTLIEGDTTRASAMQAKPLLEQYFQKAKPEDIQPSDYAYYGKLLLEIKEDSLANESFAKSIALDSSQQDVLQLHGDTYFKRKKYAEAAEAFKQLMAVRKQPLSQDYWSVGRAYYFSGQFAQADSAFTQLAERQPTVIHGPFWAARSRATIDSTMSEGLAKPMYDKVLEIALKSPDKYKKEIIEAYEYLGAYYIHKEENVAQAKSYYEKILAIDPKNEEAQRFIKTINTPAQKGSQKSGAGQR